MLTLSPRRLLAVLVILPALILTGCDSGSPDEPGIEPPEPTFRIVSVLQQVFHDGWQDGRNSVYVYDGEGLLAEVAEWSANGADVLGRQVYHYDGSGLLEELQFFQGGDLIITEFYRYDAEERIAERRTTWRGGNDWDSCVDRFVYSYDAQGLLERVTHENRSYGSDEWQLAGRDEYTYNADGSLHEVVDFGDVFGQDPEAPQSRERYTYASGVLDQTETDLWQEGDWWTNVRASYSYDEHGNISERHAELFGFDGSLLRQSRYLYTWEQVEGGEARDAHRGREHDADASGGALVRA